MTEFDNRISNLIFDLKKYSFIEKVVGKTYERPIKSIADGYPEIAITWLNNSISKILLYWLNINEKLSPNEDISIDSIISIFNSNVDDDEIKERIILIRGKLKALETNNEIDTEEVFLIFKYFIDITKWFNSQRQEKDADFSLNKAVRDKIIFIIRFYRILRYEVLELYELSEDTAYLLLYSKVGIKQDYIEIIFSENLLILQKLLNNKKTLFKTKYPLTSSYIITDDSSIKNEESISTNIFTVNSFIKKFINFINYSNSILSSFNNKVIDFIPLKGSLLFYNSHIQDYELKDFDDINKIIKNYVKDKSSGNLFLISNPGGGKTSVCKSVFNYVTQNDNECFALYYDLSLMKKNENIENFITRLTSKYFNLKTNELFEIVMFLNANGNLIILLDGFDEIFGGINIKEITDVFSEISKLFSDNSKIIITSRLSFFLSSKYISELLDKNAVVSDKVSYSLTSVGIDPMELPNFQLLKLEPINSSHPKCSLKHIKVFRAIEKSENISLTPFQYQLINGLKTTLAISSFNSQHNYFCTTKLINYYFKILIKDKCNVDFFNNFIKYFFLAFQNGQNIFNTIEIFTYFEEDLFTDNIPTYENMLFRDIFIKLSENNIKFKHKSYYEFIFAFGYIKNMPLVNKDIIITDEIRRFINELASSYKEGNELNNRSLVVPKGCYIVGDFDQVIIKQLNKNIKFDKYSVTVEEYNQFLNEIKGKKISEFEHPLQPTWVTHTPLYEKLKIKNYYDNLEYKNYPATCISWWSAYTFAKFMGKRLPTSFEWECAARGHYGNLFSWGDFVDINIANSADFWAGETLITYDKWKEHFNRSGKMRGGQSLPVDNFELNTSPFGMRNMCGNIWEYTSSATENCRKIVICGGSYDNPFRAIKTTSKGIAESDTLSNAVGFRCCKDV